ncbi:hypothetical protein F5Y17DRAFT_411637 [Xylariaceae sp. FL0594]|nr:hypothetical protein F5Y17DRAFT_411637 [Xylariaceae sp. FL0594]
MDLQERITEHSRHASRLKNIRPSGRNRKSLLVFARQRSDDPAAEVRRIISRSGRGSRVAYEPEVDYGPIDTCKLGVDQNAQELIRSYDALSEIVDQFVRNITAILGDGFLTKYDLADLLFRNGNFVHDGIMIRVRYLYESLKYYYGALNYSGVSNSNRFDRIIQKLHHPSLLADAAIADVTSDVYGPATWSFNKEYSRYYERWYGIKLEQTETLRILMADPGIRARTDLHNLLLWLVGYYDSCIRWQTQTLKNMDAALRCPKYDVSHRRRMARYLRRVETAFEAFRDQLIIVAEEVKARGGVSEPTFDKIKFITNGASWLARHCKLNTLDLSSNPGRRVNETTNPTAFPSFADNSETRAFPRLIPPYNANVQPTDGAPAVTSIPPMPGQPGGEHGLGGPSGPGANGIGQDGEKEEYDDNDSDVEDSEKLCSGDEDDQLIQLTQPRYRRWGTQRRSDDRWGSLNLTIRNPQQGGSGSGRSVSGGSGGGPGGGGPGGGGPGGGGPGGTGGWRTGGGRTGGGRTGGGRTGGGGSAASWWRGGGTGRGTGGGGTAIRRTTPVADFLHWCEKITQGVVISSPRGKIQLTPTRKVGEAVEETVEATVASGPMTITLPQDMGREMKDEIIARAESEFGLDVQSLGYQSEGLFDDDSPVSASASFPTSAAAGTETATAAGAHSTPTRPSRKRAMQDEMDEIGDTPVKTRSATRLQTFQAIGEMNAQLRAQLELLGIEMGNVPLIRDPAAEEDPFFDTVMYGT